MFIYDLGCCLLKVNGTMHVAVTLELSDMEGGFGVISSPLQNTWRNGVGFEGDVVYVTVTSEFRNHGENVAMT